LRIFPDGIVSGNHSLNFVSQGLVQGTLASDRGTPRSLRSAPCLKNFTPTLGGDATQFGSAFALTQRTM
jgi:hypothetical protein